jgi:ubiquinone/menaquinone biosynthesis C-methylase UbiE
MSPGENAEVHATDIAPAMIKIVQKKNWSNFCAEVMDAQCLTFPDNEFTHSFTKFAIMAMPGPDKAAAHIYRTLKPGGTAVITTWKDIGYMVVFHEVQLLQNGWRTLSFAKCWCEQDFRRLILRF